MKPEPKPGSIEWQRKVIREEYVEPLLLQTKKKGSSSFKY